MPASFCADGFEPNYSKAVNINSVPNDYCVNEQEVCKDIGFGNGQSYSNRRYVDSGIKVNPSDKKLQLRSKRDDN